MSKADAEYQVKKQEYYDASLKKLKKKSYKKDKRNADKLDGILENICSILSNTPRNDPPMARRLEDSISKIETEGRPSKIDAQGWEFWKLYFRLPGLSGSSREGRIMYLINEEAKEVQLLWVYNHSQYEKRPSDKDIARRWSVLFND